MGPERPADVRDTFRVLPGRFLGKVAIVTGGASGMGKAQALRLAAEGAAVAIVDINADAGDTTVRKIGSNGGTAAFFDADLTCPAQVDDALARIQRKYGTADVLFNNAGTILVKAYEETTEEEFERLMAINVRSAFSVTRRVVAEMVKHGGGSIVMMSSVSALRGFVLEAAYGVTKAAVQSLAINIAVEYRERGIRCNAICPAFVQTPHGEREIEAFLALGIPWGTEQLRDTQLRMCDADGVASVALFLASDDARLLNGVSVPIDNGWMAKA